MTRPNKTDFLHQRIDPELKKKFNKAAEKDSRTMASALEVAMKDYIKKIEGK